MKDFFKKVNELDDDEQMQKLLYPDRDYDLDDNGEDDEDFDEVNDE